MFTRLSTPILWVTCPYGVQQPWLWDLSMIAVGSCSSPFGDSRNDCYYLIKTYLSFWSRLVKSNLLLLSCLQPSSPVSLSFRCGKYVWQLLATWSFLLESISAAVEASKPSTRLTSDCFLYVWIVERCPLPYISSIRNLIKFKKYKFYTWSKYYIHN